MNELEEPSEIEIKQRSKGGVKEKWRTGSETVDCRCRSKQEVTLTLPLLSFDIFTFVVGSFSFLFFFTTAIFHAGSKLRLSYPAAGCTGRWIEMSTCFSDVVS